MNHYSSTRDTYLAQALTLSKQGLPVSTIVKLIPVDRATIYRWIAKFAVDNPQEEPSAMARKSKKDVQTQPEVPGTSSNKFRHPADAGPLPAPPFARTPFLLFSPARTHPSGTTHCRLGEKTPFCAFCMSRRQENPGKSTKRLPPRRINRPSRALQLPRRQQNNTSLL